MKLSKTMGKDAIKSFNAILDKFTASKFCRQRRYSLPRIVTITDKDFGKTSVSRKLRPFAVELDKRKISYDAYNNTGGSGGSILFMLRGIPYSMYYRPLDKVIHIYDHWNETTTTTPYHPH